MAKELDSISEELASWVNRQHLFFVATAPLTGEGMVNCSPKGLDTFAILGPHRVAYLDLTGSGAETIAHIRENGRVTLMFCAFDGPPKIVRFQGKGSVVTPQDEAFEQLISHFPPIAGIRAIVVVEVKRTSTSCGFGVPLYRYEGERTQMVDFANAKGPAGMADYQKKYNTTSLDGLPALTPDEIDATEAALSTTKQTDHTAP